MLDKKVLNYTLKRIKPNRLNVFSVSGMIGVGKTTTIQELCKQLKSQGLKVGVMFELYEDNEFSMFKEKITSDKTTELLIKEYYDSIEFLTSDDPDVRDQALAMTLTHQSMFVANRSCKSIFAINKAIREDYDVLFFDRTLYADRIFTRLNLDKDPAFMDTYIDIWKTWRNLFKSKLKEKEIKCYNIILDADIDTVLGRIKKRGREMEQGQDNYMINLHKDYVPNLKRMFVKNKLTFEIFDVSEGKDV